MIFSFLESLNLGHQLILFLSASSCFLERELVGATVLLLGDIRYYVSERSAGFGQKEGLADRVLHSMR